MDLPTSTTRATEIRWDGPNLEIPVVDSTSLLKGHRELLIRHGDQTYRLRMTASDKLILTK